MVRQADAERLKRDILKHEDNLKFLKSEANRLDDSILDSRMILGKYHSAYANMAARTRNAALNSEEEIEKEILKQQMSAAAIFYRTKTRYPFQWTKFPCLEDVLGVVATLATVDDHNLNSILSEYLGWDTMLAIVCKTTEGVKALETYDAKGNVDANTGLHGLGACFSSNINGRFLAICLEALRPYPGGFIDNDPQKKLDIPKPKLPNGMCPPGFHDFAVNMINLNTQNLFCSTASGRGLRETLFYGLFSHLQVYRTRSEMLHALPCITQGAISMDGGMIKRNGSFALGNSKGVEVRFPVTPRSNLPASYTEIDDRVKLLKWEQLNIAGDIRREQALLDKAMADLMRLC